MENKKKIFQQNKNHNKPYFNFKNRKYPYFYKKTDKYAYKNSIYYILGEKKPSKPLTTAYLHRNKKKKVGIFFKKPTLKTILYPFHLNLNLINEYLKKK